MLTRSDVIFILKAGIEIAKLFLNKGDTVWNPTSLFLTCGFFSVILIKLVHMFYFHVKMVLDHWLCL